MSLDAIAVFLLLAQGGLIQPSPAARHDSLYEKHVAGLKQKYDLSKFAVVIEKPFVVIGDEVPGQVKQRAENTIRWTVDRLKQDFFTDDPSEIIDIWLFRNDLSYQFHAKSFFGDIPSTPFGYYSSEHKGLIMNIATGGGTLVHEIVHPFMRANFPSCPPWFDEGLASLYEACQERDGHIVGLPNWRLRILKKAIGLKAVPSFYRLTSLDADEFYGENQGVYYSQARYLCYYLQEKGLLVRYYHEFRDNRERDPTGYKTLVRILGQKDMKVFKKKWEKFTLSIDFPEE